MPAPSQTLDVWIVESNVVYQRVPFTVVTDWIQQGRLLDDDRVRAPGAPEWGRLADHTALAVYLPRPEPHRAEDRAEALEPVELGFSWRKRRPDDDEDVDMIPLIDVSLVLLVFFMMTATVGGAVGLIPTPQASHGYKVAHTGHWVGIDCRRDTDNRLLRDTAGNVVPIYSWGEKDKLADADGWNLTTAKDVIAKLAERIPAGAQVEVRIKAHPQVPYEVVRDLTIGLERLKATRQIGKVYAEVSEREER